MNYIGHPRSISPVKLVFEKNPKNGEHFLKILDLSTGQRSSVPKSGIREYVSGKSATPEVKEFDLVKDLEKSLDQQQFESVDTDLINMSINNFDEISLGSIGPRIQKSEEKVSPAEIANNTDQKKLSEDSEDTQQSDDEEDLSSDNIPFQQQSSGKKHALRNPLFKNSQDSLLELNSTPMIQDFLEQGIDYENGNARKMYLENQNLTDQIQMWRMVEQLQNKATLIASPEYDMSVIEEETESLQKSPDGGDLEISPSHDSTFESKMLSYTDPFHARTIISQIQHYSVDHSKSITKYKFSDGSQPLRGPPSTSNSDALKPIAIICDSQVSSSALSFNCSDSELRGSISSSYVDIDQPNKCPGHSRNLTMANKDSSTTRFEVVSSTASTVSSSESGLRINMPQQMPSIKSPHVLNKLQKPLPVSTDSLAVRKQLFGYQPPQPQQNRCHQKKLSIPKSPKNFEESPRSRFQKNFKPKSSRSSSSQSRRTE